MVNLEINNGQKSKVAFFKSKKFFIILAIFIIGLGISGYFIREHNLEVEAKEQAEKVRKQEAKYIKVLNDTTSNIERLSGNLLKISAMYSEVWNETIDHDLYLSGLAKYLGVEESSLIAAAPSGKIKSNFRGKYIARGDFNTALLTVKGVWESVGTIDDISKAQSDIASTVKGLNNPPEKYKDVYEEVLNYYSTYEKLLGLAVSPSGSYLTYTRDINTLSSELESQYSKIQVVMP
ncbi:hypothetical protein P5G62_023385 [Neobacillus sp. 179-C4.2 HS]|uniref:Uncharacterized protein n=1 Tax=Neobacillus driksii TaxID=3035913 RepID=A0ABV4YYY1_9BACI|nr:hypothetical protein [Neobacillus sp. 179.-C4.2 HS]MDP5194637.1 hypothetical protein [Neobacillus sp. 179.-C4.2 HS]